MKSKRKKKKKENESAVTGYYAGITQSFTMLYILAYRALSDIEDTATELIFVIFVMLVSQMAALGLLIMKM